MSKVVKAKYTAEAVCGFTHRTAMEEAARCLLCHDAPCSQGCPAEPIPRNLSVRSASGMLRARRKRFGKTTFSGNLRESLPL